MVTTDYSSTRRGPGLKFSVHTHWLAAIVARRLIAQYGERLPVRCFV